MGWRQHGRGQSADSTTSGLPTRSFTPVGATHREFQEPVRIAENGRTRHRFGAEEEESEVALSAGASAALDAIGGWSSLDWDETIENLERIRRESKPSPPPDDL